MHISLHIQQAIKNHIKLKIKFKDIEKYINLLLKWIIISLMGMESQLASHKLLSGNIDPTIKRHALHHIL